MEVITEPFENVGERDEQGYFEYLYRGTLFTFRQDSRGLLARQYGDEPQEVHFLCRLTEEQREPFREIPYGDEFFFEAVGYLARELGIKEVRVLLPSGYSPVDLEKMRNTP